MKINIGAKKGAETVSNLFHKTADISKTAVENVQKSTKAVAEKTRNESYLRRLKKYNPVFPEQYTDEEFKMPKMITVVDETVRKGIDVCEGAIGWLSDESGMEVLHLYDNASNFKNLEFVPNFSCDSVYYVDSFNTNRFIRLDCIFSKAHEERIAELKNIAYSLGAKRCSIEISESDKEAKVDNRKLFLKDNFNLRVGTASGEKINEMSCESMVTRKGKVEIEFEGNDNPVYPELKWFADNENIKKLIEMRCSNTNSIKSEMIEIIGSSCAVMSQKTANSIDCAINGIGVKTGAGMETQAIKEVSSKLFFNIEF